MFCKTCRILWNQNSIGLCARFQGANEDVTTDEFAWHKFWVKSLESVEKVQLRKNQNILSADIVIENIYLGEN